MGKNPGGAKRGPDFVNPNEAIEYDEGPDTERIWQNVLLATGALMYSGSEGVKPLIDCLLEDLPTLRALIAVGDMHRADLINLLEAHPRVGS
jgi:hypothetical protein